MQMSIHRRHATQMHKISFPLSPVYSRPQITPQISALISAC